MTSALLKPSRNEYRNACSFAATESAPATESASSPAIFGRYVVLVESSAVVIGEFGGTQCPRGGSGATRPSAEPVTDRELVAGSGGAGQRGGGTIVYNAHVYMILIKKSLRKCVRDL